MVSPSDFIFNQSFNLMEFVNGRVFILKITLVAYDYSSLISKIVG